MNNRVNILQDRHNFSESVTTAIRAEARLPDAPTSHLLIAGTGRAGTSFLVRYLTELGLDTHLSRRGPAGEWDSRANAGFEDDLLSSEPGSAPYVVKSPWLYTNIDAILKDHRFHLDGVVVPVRPLREVTMSRIAVEMQARHANDPALADTTEPLTAFGTTAGGVIHSLEPLDQERVLATGFHHLMEQLVASDVPLVLAAFPRIVEDGAYLYRRLRPFLPLHITEEQALAAHERIAAPKQVRMGREFGETIKESRDRMGTADAEVIALRRELRRLRDELQVRDLQAAPVTLREVVARRLRGTRIWGWARALRHTALLASSGHFRR